MIVKKNDANIKEKKCVGMIFVDPLTGEKVEKLQDLFVDDLAGGTNKNENEQHIECKCDNERKKK